MVEHPGHGHGLPASPCGARLRQVHAVFSSHALVTVIYIPSNPCCKLWRWSTVLQTEDCVDRTRDYFGLCFAFSFHQYTKYSIDGNNEIANMGSGKINLGEIIERTSTMMNPKSEISPPIPALHHAMISPVNAIRRQATIGINKMSSG